MVHTKKGIFYIIFTKELMNPASMFYYLWLPLIHPSVSCSFNFGLLPVSISSTLFCSRSWLRFCVRRRLTVVSLVSVVSVVMLPAFLRLSYSSWKELGRPIWKICIETVCNKTKNILNEWMNECMNDMHRCWAKCSYITWYRIILYAILTQLLTLMK